MLNSRASLLAALEVAERAKGYTDIDYVERDCEPMMQAREIVPVLLKRMLLIDAVIAPAEDVVIPEDPWPSMLDEIDAILRGERDREGE